MRASVQASPDDIDITLLWQALRKHGLRLLLLALLAATLTYVGLALVAPKFTSEAQLAVVAKGAPDPFADPAREGSSSDAVAVRMDKEAVNTHVRALLSPDLATEIAGELKLADRVEFNSALGAEDTFDAILRLVGLSGPRRGETIEDRVQSAYFRKLDVYAPKESRFIGVRFTANDPELSAEIANRLTEKYLRSLSARGAVATNEAQLALEPRIAELSKELSAAEAEVERFRGEANIFRGGPQSATLSDQQLGELTAELSRAQAVRGEAEARAGSARDMMKTGSAEALPDVQKSPLIQNLVQQRVRSERQMAELAATLLPAHPRMRQITAELAGLKRQITAEVAKVVDSLEKEAKVAALREEAAAATLERMKKIVVNTGDDTIKLRRLEAGTKAKRAELERLEAQLENARARSGARGVPIEAQIITKARAASVPSFPRKGPYAALVMLATLLLGAAWTITIALMQGARPVRAGATAAADPGPISARKPDARRAEPKLPAPSSAPIADRYVTVQNADQAARRLTASKQAASGCRALVTGASNTIDPSTEAIALVRRLAREDKSVVLIDCGRDSSGVAEKFGFPKAPGFSELTSGKAKFDQVVRRLPDCDAHFISAGGSISGAGLADGDLLNMLLDALDEAYDHIVICGRTEPARSLFAAIEGRFDAGILVVDALTHDAALAAPDQRFLGFEVVDIELIRFVRAEARGIASKIAAQAPRVRAAQPLHSEGRSA